jgi:membrane protein DedA with SNARE-associated domain
MLAGKPCWPGVLCEFGFARRTTEACERAWLLGGGAHRWAGKYGIALAWRNDPRLAAIYAATEPSFNVGVVIAVAAFGAIVGDNAGYWLGLRYGYALLLRYGERIGMFEARIKLGQYLFLKHGAKVVFLGRFVALLRMLAAFLAGVNRMPWRAFLVANACGGIIWAAVFGIGGYFFGKLLLQLHHAFALIVFALALAAFFGCGYLVRRYEDRLTVLAERALPGPLVAAVGEKRP